MMPLAKDGDTVKVQYTGRLDDGKVFDSSKDSGLLEFRVGEEEVIPGLDDAVLGMAPGEIRTVKIRAERAFGPRQIDLIKEFDSRHFPSYLKPEKGKVLNLRQCQGMVRAEVLEVSGLKVILDMNHPLSGKDLTFDLRLVEIA